MCRPIRVLRRPAPELPEARCITGLRKVQKYDVSPKVYEASPERTKVFEALLGASRNVLNTLGGRDVLLSATTPHQEKKVSRKQAGELEMSIKKLMRERQDRSTEIQVRQSNQENPTYKLDY